MSSRWRRQGRNNARQQTEIRRLQARFLQLSRSQSVLRRSLAYQEALVAASAWLEGLGPPAADFGAVNDWYFDANNGDVYSKTESGGWTFQRNLTGPAGATQDLTPYALKAQVPSLEEIFTAAPLGWSVGTMNLAVPSPGHRAPVFAAPFPLYILSVALIFNNDIASSATDYWTFNVEVNPGTSSYIATQTTNGNPATRWVPWTFIAAFDITLRKLATGQGLFIRAATTGSPAALASVAHATVRYARQ